MPKLAAFPKCFMIELCETHTMTIFEWIDLASGLGVDGLELYPGFFLHYQRPYLSKVRAALQDKGLLATKSHYSRSPRL